MIIEPSLDISASLSLSSVFAREVSNPALSSFVFYVGAIIPNWKESGTVCFLYLSARFVGTARSVNKIAGKEGRKKDRVRCWLIEIFSSYQLSLSLSVYLFFEKRDRRIFISTQSRKKISRGDEFYRARANWKVARFMTPGSGHTTFDIKARPPLRIITLPRATLFPFSWTGVENSIQRIQSDQSLSKDESFSLSTCTDGKRQKET